MNEFLKKIACILELEKVQENDVLNSFAAWDSLSVLSTIAMLDANYGVNLHASDIQSAKTAGDLWKLIQTK